jgi:capsular polysaccharide biosynthesis protein
LFENADIVIGVKGAALTNAIFCRDNCHVILLIPTGDEGDSRGFVAGTDLIR